MSRNVFKLVVFKEYVENFPQSKNQDRRITGGD